MTCGPVEDLQGFGDGGWRGFGPACQPLVVLEVGDLLRYGEVYVPIPADTLRGIMISRVTSFYSHQIYQRASGDVGSELSDEVET